MYDFSIIRIIFADLTRGAIAINRNATHNRLESARIDAVTNFTDF